MQMYQKEERSIPTAAETFVDYQPLIEALNNWQAIFELALDEAALRLSPDQFPAKELSASLAEMCELLRDVLAKNSSFSTLQL
jgi:hypothetical protein